MSRSISRLGVCLLVVAVAMAFMPLLSQDYSLAKAKKVKKITLQASSKTVQVGKTATVKVKSVSPKKASKKVTWKIKSGSKYAKLTSKKATSVKVKGIKAGTVTIQAISKSNKKVKATVKIKVIKANYADTILTNGKFYTQDANNSVAEAVAIKAGKIIFVGKKDDAALKAMKGPDTVVTDLEGKMVTPSMIDAHTHPQSVAFDRTITIGWTYEIDKIVAECKDYIEKNPGNPFYEFRYYPSDLASKNNLKTLEASQLDALGDVPVMLYDFSDHSFWFNNKALELMKIDKDTPDPEGTGQIGRYGDVYSDEECAALGHDPKDPTGVINESASYTKYLPNLYEAVGWQPSDTLTEEQWQNLIDYYHSVGVTGICDAGNPSLPTEKNLELLSQMDKEGKVNVYYNYMVRGTKDQVDDVIKKITELKKFETDNIKVDTMKYFLDGTNEIGTSSVVEPFEEAEAGRPDDYGHQNATTEELTEMMMKLNDAGYDLQIHLVGDGAFRSVCDATEAAQKACKDQGKDWVMQVEMVHCELIHKQDETRPAELGIIVNWSPHWTGGYFGDEAKLWLGKDRFDSMYNFQPMIQAGAIVNFGSDVVSQYEFERARPVFGMHCAITRIDPEFPMDAEAYPNSMRPLESSKFTMDQMIKGYTLNGAIQFRIEDQTGSIEVGKNADLTVWNENLFDVDESKLMDVTVNNVIFKGRSIYAGSGN